MTGCYFMHCSTDFFICVSFSSFASIKPHNRSHHLPPCRCSVLAWSRWQAQRHFSIVMITDDLVFVLFVYIDCLVECLTIFFDLHSQFHHSNPKQCYYNNHGQDRSYYWKQLNVLQVFSGRFKWMTDRCRFEIENFGGRGAVCTFGNFRNQWWLNHYVFSKIIKIIISFDKITGLVHAMGKPWDVYVKKLCWDIPGCAACNL